MIDEKLIDRVYDTLPKMPRTNEPYYSRSAIRLILEAQSNIVGAAFRIAEPDGGPCPIEPPACSSACCSVTAITEHPPCASYSYATATYGPAGSAVDNDGTIDIRATEDDPRTPYQKARNSIHALGIDSEGLLIPEEEWNKRQAGALNAPTLEPQSRVRVRDELAKIIADELCCGHACSVTQPIVDRILNKLIERIDAQTGGGADWARYQAIVVGVLDDVKAGRL